jgi:hypothetical protein
VQIFVHFHCLLSELDQKEVDKSVGQRRERYKNEMLTNEAFQSDRGVGMHLSRKS